MNHRMTYVPFTEKEKEKIKKLWRKDLKTIILLPAFMIFGFGFTALISKFTPESDVTSYLIFGGIPVLFFIGLSLVLYITSSYRKDYACGKKVIMQTCLTTHKYRLKTPFVNMPLVTLLPLPVDENVVRIKYRNTLGSSNQNKAPSGFTIYLENGFRYKINEHTHISSDAGAYLELHLASKSGTLLSFKPLAAKEIKMEKGIYSIMQNLYTQDNFMEEIEKMDDFFKEDTDADEIIPDARIEDFYTIQQMEETTTINTKNSKHNDDIPNKGSSDIG